MARKTFQGPNPVTVAGVVTLPWGRAKLIEICRPSKVKIDVVSANFDWATLTTLAAIPSYSSAAQIELNNSPNGAGSWATGSRTGFPIEGPYLVYRAGKASMGQKYDGIGEAGEFSTNLIGHWDNTDECEWVFDLAVRRPIYFPYPGTLEIIGQLPGTWVVEAWVLQGGNAEKQSPIESEVTLTAQIAPSADVSSRTFGGIPSGAHSFTYRDSLTALGAFPKTQITLDDQTKNDVGPGGVALIGIPQLADYANQSSQFYGRWGLANAMQIRQFGVAIGSVGEMQFHISLM